MNFKCTEAMRDKNMTKRAASLGMLSVSFLSTVLGTMLPGAGSVFIGASVRFKAPVRIGDKVVATCSVREIDAAKRRVTFDCYCKVGDLVVIEGDALVKVPTRAARGEG